MLEAPKTKRQKKKSFLWWRGSLEELHSSLAFGLRRSCGACGLAALLLPPLYFFFILPWFVAGGQLGDSSWQRRVPNKDNYHFSCSAGTIFFTVLPSSTIQCRHPPQERLSLARCLQPAARTLSDLAQVREGGKSKVASEGGDCGKRRWCPLWHHKSGDFFFILELPEEQVENGRRQTFFCLLTSKKNE